MIENIIQTYNGKKLKENIINALRNFNRDEDFVCHESGVLFLQLRHEWDRDIRNGILKYLVKYINENSTIIIDKMIEQIIEDITKEVIATKPAVEILLKQTEEIEKKYKETMRNKNE